MTSPNCPKCGDACCLEEATDETEPRKPESQDEQAVPITFYFWKFIHNALIHPMMSGPWKEPSWLNFMHDWTAKRCRGAG